MNDIKKNTSEHMINQLSGSMDFLVAKKQHSYKATLIQFSHEVFSVHNEVEILYMIRGKIKLQTKYGERILNEGDHCLIKPRTAHKVIAEEKDNIIFVFQMDETKLREIETSDLNNVEKYVKADKINKILFEKIGNLYLQQIRGMKDFPEVQQDVMIIGHCINKLLSRRPTYVTNDNMDSIQMVVYDVAEAYITEGNFRKTLEEITDEYNISYSYFSRMFRELTGLSFTRFVTKLKLSFVAEQLLSTDDAIVDISFSCGYKESRQMNRVFKKHFNMSPISMRNKYKKVQLESDENSLRKIPEIKPFLEQIEKKGFLESANFLRQSEFSLYMEETLGVCEKKWGVVTDFESLMINKGDCSKQKMINIGKLLFKELSIRFIRFKVKHMNGNFYFRIENDQWEIVDEMMMESVISLALEFSVIPIFQIDFGLKYNYLIDPPVGHKELYLGMLEKFNRLFRNLSSEHLKICRYELYIDIFNTAIKESSLDIVSYGMSAFVELIKEKVGHEKKYRGLHTGDFTLNSKRLDCKHLRILKNHLVQFDFFSAQFILTEKKQINMLDFNSIQDRYCHAESRLNKMLPKGFDGSNPHLMIDVTYELKRKIKKSMKAMTAYHALLNMILTEPQRSFSVISNFQLKWIENHQKHIQSFAFTNNTFKEPLHYLLNLYQLMDGNEVIMAKEGCYIAKYAESILGIFYLGYRDYIEAVSCQNVPRSRQHQIVIPKASGKYKISEYTFNESICSKNQESEFYADEAFFQQEEYNYIQKTMMPELTIDCKEFVDGVYHTVNLQPYDICIVKIDKLMAEDHR
ncbi:AraC family transcriptional regulator [Tindallia californiensis]|uniref:AraC-type DNA-binding protein n=1 Tax=Tindallia californiensis TaxID=159292 RepID=A0A1H3M8F6_9FIRM|nr:helix-turn-helix domain-containing protein [Tindallia californiensis]SDY72295.1 AraC-type DNA-binding protein [Tindallia californiensis]